MKPIPYTYYICVKYNKYIYTNIMTTPFATGYFVNTGTSSSPSYKD